MSRSESAAAQPHELRLTWAFNDPGLVHRASSMSNEIHRASDEGCASPCRQPAAQPTSFCGARSKPRACPQHGDQDTKRDRCPVSRAWGRGFFWGCACCAIIVFALRVAGVIHVNI